MKLKSLDLLTTLKPNAKFNRFVLTPKAYKIISPEDTELIKENGIAIISCSWALFNEVKVKCLKGNKRFLPLFMTLNPLHYGKEFKLNYAGAFEGAF